MYCTVTLNLAGKPVPLCCIGSPAIYRTVDMAIVITIMITFSTYSLPPINPPQTACSEIVMTNHCLFISCSHNLTTDTHNNYASVLHADFITGNTRTYWQLYSCISKFRYKLASLLGASGVERTCMLKLLKIYCSSGSGGEVSACWIELTALAWLIANWGATSSQDWTDNLIGNHIPTKVHYPMLACTYSPSLMHDQNQDLHAVWITVWGRPLLTSSWSTALNWQK